MRLNVSNAYVILSVVEAQHDIVRVILSETKCSRRISDFSCGNQNETFNLLSKPNQRSLDYARDDTQLKIRNNYI